MALVLKLILKQNRNDPVHGKTLESGHFCFVLRCVVRGQKELAYASSSFLLFGSGIR